MIWSSVAFFLLQRKIRLSAKVIEIFLADRTFGIAPVDIIEEFVDDEEDWRKVVLLIDVAFYTDRVVSTFVC